MKSLLIVLVFIFSGIANADSLKRADEKDISMLLSAASGENSAYWASYIGESRGRVYIQYESAVHASSLFTKDMSHEVYWIPVQEIKKSDLDKLKSYKIKYESK